VPLWDVPWERSGMPNVIVGPVLVPIMLDDGSTGTATMPRQIVTLKPPLSAPLWSCDFAGASLGPLSASIQPVLGVPALPWGSPPLAIQCLGAASAHHHSVSSTGLRLAMASGSGSDQAALMVQPRVALHEFYVRARITLDPGLASVLSPGANWQMVQEWKTGGWPPAPYGGDLRATLQVQMDAGGVLHWRMGLDTNANDASVPLATLYDSAYSSKALVRPGTPQLVEHYCRRSLGNSGLVWWKVDGVLVGQFAGPNFGVHSAEINRLMLTNLYSAAWLSVRSITDIMLYATVPP